MASCICYWLSSWTRRTLHVGTPDLYLMSPGSSDLPATFSATHGDLQRFRGGLVVKAHRLLHYSTLGLRVKKEKKIEKHDLPPRRGLVGNARAQTVQMRDSDKWLNHLQGYLAHKKLQPS